MLNGMIGHEVNSGPQLDSFAQGNMGALLLNKNSFCRLFYWFHQAKHHVCLTKHEV
jgi:hypothetical protein